MAKRRKTKSVRDQKNKGAITLKVLSPKDKKKVLDCQRTVVSVGTDVQDIIRRRLNGLPADQRWLIQCRVVNYIFRSHYGNLFSELVSFEKDLIGNQK